MDWFARSARRFLVVEQARFVTRYPRTDGDDYLLFASYALYGMNQSQIYRRLRFVFLWLPSRPVRVYLRFGCGWCSATRKAMIPEPSSI